MMSDWPETLRQICVGLPCRQQAPMTFLSWDESCFRVLAWQSFVTRFAEMIRDTPRGPSIPPWRTPNEFALLFPSCPARVGSGSRDLVRSWQRVGAIAAIGGPSRGERPGDISA